MKIYVVMLNGLPLAVRTSKNAAHMCASDYEGDVEVRSFTDDHLNVQKQHGERIAARRKDNAYS